MSSSAEALENPDVAGISRTAFTYSILRVEPDPVRGEFINVGVAMVDDGGTYSKLLFNYRIQSRLSALGGGRLLHTVLAALGVVIAAYDVAGTQLRPELRTLPAITKTELKQWSAERGGIVRMSPPRVVLADDPDAAFESVYRRYVRAPAQPPAMNGLTPEAERSLLRDRFVRALKGLENFDPARVHVGGPVRGERAHHWLDVAIVGAGAATAFAHAIPLGASDERPVFIHRGLVLEAAGDMPPQAPRLALYDDPPDSRRELFDETRDLLSDAGVDMVGQTQLASAAARFDEHIWQGTT
jgi:hypothetical protein